MQIVTVFIEADASVTFLKSPLTAGFNLGPSVTRRASHVQPNNVALRLVFQLLRLVFGDTGAVAATTRAWPCLWRADMRPIGGPVLQGRWRNRQTAINVEEEFFNKYGVNYALHQRSTQPSHSLL
jgi:hypothetical protein